jgi:hypothetical protein
MRLRLIRHATLELDYAGRRHAPDAHVVAVHLEAINHCLEPRSALRDLPVSVPADGAEL